MDQILTMYIDLISLPQIFRRFLNQHPINKLYFQAILLFSYEGTNLEYLYNNRHTSPGHQVL